MHAMAQGEDAQTMYKIKVKFSLPGSLEYIEYSINPQAVRVQISEVLDIFPINFANGFILHCTTLFAFFNHFQLKLIHVFFVKR